MKITLCGSCKYVNMYHEINKKLTLAGHIVYSLAWFSDENNKPSGTEKEMLDLIHLAKIKESDAIVVIDCDGFSKTSYFGESTLREIRWSAILNKKIVFLSQTTDIIKVVGEMLPPSKCLTF